MRLLVLIAGVACLRGPIQAADSPPFIEVAAASGLDFVHFNGMSGELYFSEVVGSGAALFDCDNDGDLDLYLSQGSMLDPTKTPAQALYPPVEGAPPGGRLYRNDLPAGAAAEAPLEFTDITPASGIAAYGYGMGVATGDYDNDGWVDFYVSNADDDQMWHNEGGCTFSDATASAGLGNPRWSVSATFLDFDRDGWLDLFVGNYVDFTVATHKPCFSTSSARDYCGPRSYNPQPDLLFHNRGDGTFEDVSAVSGIALESGGALGVISADFNLDGWPDLYVGNDQVQNFMWINQQDGKFLNEAVFNGVAVNMEGAPEASMGVDVADFDGDGDEDIFLTHLDRQTNTIYVNEGAGGFSDQTLSLGLGAPSYRYTSFGMGWFDYDNDGWLDLVIVNGAVQVIEELAAKNDPFPLHQINQLFHNLGDGRFEELTDRAGPAFELSEVSRGAAFGDIDNDGDIDIVITNNNGPVRLLRNEVGNRNAWIGLRLIDPAVHRDAVGSRVAIHLPSGRVLWRRVRTDGSYASARDPRLLVGLGTAQGVGKVEVVWPDGSRESWNDLPVGRYTTLSKGTRESGDVGE